MSWNELLWLASLEQDLQVGVLVEDQMIACDVRTLPIMDLLFAFWAPGLPPYRSRNCRVRL
jgi:hypothetical protein